MQILTTVAELRAARARLRTAGSAVHLVPTMGALHAGHLSLVRAAQSADASAFVAVSIFVNPAQFSPDEDFTRYPRTFEADCTLLKAEGVGLVFAPPVEQMYPRAGRETDGIGGMAGSGGGFGTRVHVAGISERLDGASRAGHFDGVATVVAKLFHLIEPHRAYFGQKDAAQLAVLRAMVRDLDFPVELIACPIVREPDGLAMSSRNRYLSPQERAQALVLKRALDAASALAMTGENRTSALVAEAAQVLHTEPAAKVDYIAAVDPDTLLPVSLLDQRTLFAVAAFVGRTRLIDNVELGGESP